MVEDFPLFPSLFIFICLSLKFWLFFLCLDKLCYNNFQYPFKPKGAGTFSTALNFMEEYSDYVVCYYYYKITTVSGWTPRRVKNLHKSTKWTDPMKFKNFHKSTKWTDPMKGQDSSP